MMTAAENEQFELRRQVPRPHLHRRATSDKQRIAQPKAMTPTFLASTMKMECSRQPLSHARWTHSRPSRVLLDKIPYLEIGTQFEAGGFFSSFLMQLYSDQQYMPKYVYVPVDFEDRPSLEEVLGEHFHGRIEIQVPQRGDKRSLIDLAGNNANNRLISVSAQ